ncbi:hypothetical protein [Tenacibaculum jejuense]|uniref:DUF5648 domain-containing protein n=1 Tax=Tenacibaculum jejuense TaxID=584609 RepID=A0A238U6L1_9FLAO|nr:hypothetical protein [Tenacibaculum jejuense]SNR14839.1 protein of unknown function [Tenacibaculum jejuense]
MKTINFKTGFLALTLSTMGLLTSCEQQETLIEDPNVVEVSDVEIETTTLQNRTTLMGVGRFFLGGANSLHTYRVGNIGANLGRREGVPFKLGIFNKVSTPTPPAGTKQLFFLLSPGNRDFVLTTSASERNTLQRRRWRNVSEFNFQDRESGSGRLLFNQSAFIHNSGGSGRVKLYRFYGSSNTDHLYTTNYQEGVNAGYAFEGVVGWVHL